MLTKDYAPGIESARREALGSTRPGNDYSHLRRFLHSELQHHLTKTTTVRQENFPFPVNVKTYLDVILRLFDAQRTLPTIDIFTVIWDIWGNTIDCKWEERAARKYIDDHAHTVSASDLRTAYNIPTRSTDDTPLKFAPHWCGLLGTPPGVASGTQAVEAFHSPWEKEMEILGPAGSPHSALTKMQELFHTWSREMPYGSPESLSLHCDEINPDFLHNIALLKVGSNPAFHYYTNRASGNVVKIKDEADGAILGVASCANACLDPGVVRDVVSFLHMNVEELKNVFREKGIVCADGCGVDCLHIDSFQKYFMDVHVVLVGEKACKFHHRSEVICICLFFALYGECMHTLFVRALPLACRHTDVNLHAYATRKEVADTHSGSKRSKQTATRREATKSARHLILHGMMPVKRSAAHIGEPDPQTQPVRKFRKLKKWNGDWLQCDECEAWVKCTADELGEYSDRGFVCNMLRLNCKQ